ncbi:DDE_3 domain-containing protein [Trichonephila clavipes]|nr:DDE_3 domain-containing protein [Trichonephila clavipes]
MQKTELQMLNDDEIVTSVQQESDPVDDETDEDEDNNNDENSKGQSNVRTRILRSRELWNDECLQSEDITRMDWPAYSPDLNPIEHVWDMLGERIAAFNLLPPVYLRSNSWDAQLAVPNDPRYVDWKQIWGLDRARKGGNSAETDL